MSTQRLKLERLLTKNLQRMSWALKSALSKPLAGHLGGRKTEGVLPCLVALRGLGEQWGKVVLLCRAYLGSIHHLIHQPPSRTMPINVILILVQPAFDRGRKVFV